MNKSPCKDCPDRHLHCHSECDRYKTFAKEKRELNELINKARHERNLYYSPHYRYVKEKLKHGKFYNH
jgi:hypothetical protein